MVQVLSAVGMIDWLVLGILVVSVLLGLVRGVVREVVALVSWAAALLLARHFCVLLAGHMEGLITSAPLRLIAAFLAIFLLSLLALGLLGRLLHSLLGKAGLAPADRILGGIFGLVRGILILLVVVLLAGMTSLPQMPEWQGSRSTGVLVSLALEVKPWLPEGLARRINFGRSRGPVQGARARDDTRQGAD